MKQKSQQNRSGGSEHVLPLLIAHQAALEVSTLKFADGQTRMKMRKSLLAGCIGLALLLLTMTSGWAQTGNANWDERFGQPGISSSVSALAVFNHELYAGGSITAAGDYPAMGIAKWDGTRWSALGTGVNNDGTGDVGPATVFALATNGSALYVGGRFTQAGGVNAEGIAKWDGTHWSAVGTGLTGTVYAIAVSGNTV